VKKSPEARTLAEAVEACRRRLSSVSETPWLDARLLAQHVTGLDASAIIAYGDTGLDVHRRRRLFELLERRAAGEPIAYLIGKKSFCGLEIFVDRRVLVPRPETEELVLVCADEWRGRAAHVLDVGTGSGAIACALAHLLPDARITATDSSVDALTVARANAERLGFGEQIAFAAGDLLAGLDNAARFDVIIANLPYVAEDHAGQLQDSVREHEPAEALFGGSDGLAVYRRLAPSLPDRMTPGAAVYLECAFGNAAALAALMQAALPSASVEVRADLQGLERMVIARSPAAVA